MDVDFCEKCENLLYLYIDSETNKIVLQCKACGHEKPMENKVIKINNAISKR